MQYDLRNIQSATEIDGDDRYFEDPNVEARHPGEVAELLLWRPGARPMFDIAYKGINDDRRAAEISKLDREQKESLRKARLKLARLTQAIRLVRSRIKYLNPKSAASNHEIETEFNYLTRQLEQLNATVKDNPNRFEVIMIDKYDHLMQTIHALHGKLRNLEQVTMRGVG